MNADIRRDLKSKILEKNEEMGLKDILTSTFVRQITENLQISAADMAYVISSLLEAPTALNMLTETEIKKPEEHVEPGQDESMQT